MVWLTDRSGLRFGRHGVVYSSGALPASLSSAQACSLEIAFRPAATGKDGTILAFDSSPDPRMPFQVKQVGSSIALQRYAVEGEGEIRYPWSKVDRVLQEGKPEVLAVTSTAQRTNVYVNGALAAGLEGDAMSCRDLNGRFVLGNSTTDNGWTGEIYGLALFDRELLPREVQQEFSSSLANGSLGQSSQALAFYALDQKDGQTVRSKTGGPDLSIPTRYEVLHPALLNPIWSQYAHQGAFWRRCSVWQDILVNVAGFVPVGFFFLAYCDLVKRSPHASAKVILFGFLLSLTIEVVQRFLPTRDSGMMDLVTNTAGTALGVGAFRLIWARSRQFREWCSTN